MPYQVLAIKDRFGRVVGFLDGHFVLAGDRRVVAEVRFGTVLRFDGRVCGEYDGVHFFDRRRAMVATTISGVVEAVAYSSRELSDDVSEFGSYASRGSPAVLADAPNRVEWSPLDWHRYVEV